MSKTISELLSDANVIKAELTQGKNTANRVGTMLIDIIEYMRTLPHSVMQTIDTGANTYKTEIDGRISSIDSLIDKANEDIEELQRSEWLDVKEKVTQILNSEGFIDGWYTGWVESIKSYLISVGLIDANGNQMWSTISTKVDSIDLNVNKLSYLDDNIEAFNSRIHSLIDGDSVVTELKSRYVLSDKQQNILKWLETGNEQYVDPDTAINRMFATAEDMQEQINATALLQQQITDIKGTYVVRTELVNTVKDEVDGKISSAGVVTEVTIDSAVTELFAEDKSSGTKAAVAAIVEDGIGRIEIDGDFLKLQNGKAIITNDDPYFPAFEAATPSGNQSTKILPVSIRITDNTINELTYLQPGEIKLSGAGEANFRLAANFGIPGEASPGFTFKGTDAPAIVHVLQSGAKIAHVDINANTSTVSIYDNLYVDEGLSVGGNVSASEIVTSTITAKNSTITLNGNVSCSSIGSTNGYLVNGAIGKTGSFEDKNGNIIRVSGGIIISLS